ncbi:MAG: cell surface protein [Chthoniobacteraceae bacterium]|nr:cell surface protein [Chthoniobacteraceae bacterium]
MIRRTLFTGAAFAALFHTYTLATPEPAAGYATALFYTHPNNDLLASYDWDKSGNIYYQTSVESAFGGFYCFRGGSTSLLVSGNPVLFAGASVAGIGNFVYFNNSDFAGRQLIYKFGPLDSAATVTQISMAPNYGLYGHDGDLFITGGVDSGANGIYQSALNISGNLVSNPPISLGATSGGASGPLAFDAAGNLFYAPGYGDKSIYRWTAAQVGSAVLDPLNAALGISGQHWVDYSALYPLQTGATSMLVQSDGDLLVTITDFTNLSYLARFGTALDGSYGGIHENILTDSSLLGQLREYAGGLYVSSNNSIYQIIPEPGACWLLFFGIVALFLRRAWAPSLSRAIILLGILSAVGSAQAGSYASYSGVTPGASDNPIARSQFTLFENSVVNYSPSPGVGLNFRAYQTSITSLGELYSPVAAPGANTPFDRRFQPQAGSEPNAGHNGSTSSPFGGDIHDSADSYGFIGVDLPGSITLGFSAPIYNGAGADFAVFENGFAFGGPTSLFAEFAYVEVSSNGQDFARFASISLNTAPTATSGAFQGFDVTNVYNLAGKSAANWGTPFDLAGLVGDPLVLSGLLDLSSVNYIRLVDVVGSGTILDGANSIAGISRDSLGNPILDNWLTYDSAGFDYLGLSAHSIGVVYSAPEPTSALLLAIGCTALASGRRRRK